MPQSSKAAPMPIPRNPLSVRLCGLLLLAIAGCKSSPPGIDVADPGRIALDEFLEECSDRGLTSEPDVRQYVDGEIKQTITLHHLHWRAE